MIDEDLQDQILRDLYLDQYDLSAQIDSGIEAFEAKYGKQPFHINFQVLCDRGMIDGVRENLWLSPIGVDFVEENGIAPPSLIQKVDTYRMRILDELAKVYETGGTYSGLSQEEIIERSGLHEDIFIRVIHYMMQSDYFRQDMPVSRFYISDFGLDEVTDWRQAKAIGEDFETLKKVTNPQKRGKDLEKVFAKAFEYEGWESETNVISSGEEADIIIHQGREYYMIECKWLNIPVEKKHIRPLAKVRKHIQGYKGLRSG